MQKWFYHTALVPVNRQLNRPETRNALVLLSYSKVCRPAIRQENQESLHWFEERFEKYQRKGSLASFVLDHPRDNRKEMREEERRHKAQCLAHELLRSRQMLPVPTHLFHFMTKETSC